jgi:hypothetical protein
VNTFFGGADSEIQIFFLVEESNAFKRENKYHAYNNKSGHNSGGTPVLFSELVGLSREILRKHHL